MKGPEIQPPRPNSCAYWVSTDLLAGEHPTDKSGRENTRLKLQQYLDCGITYFVDLTEEGERPNYQALLKEEATAKGINNVDYVRLPVHDFGIPTKVHMTRILNAVDNAMAEGHKVYLHCRGGIGRTGTAVGCYLVRHGLSGEDALDEVNRLFQASDQSMTSYSSPETSDQMNFVRGWKKGL